MVLQAVESLVDRLEVARKLAVSNVVVDVLLAQKDRAALIREPTHSITLRYSLVNIDRI